MAQRVAFALCAMLHALCFFNSFHNSRMSKAYFAAFLIFFAALGFTRYQTGSKLPLADKNNGGLFLPGGFEAVVVIDSIGGGSGRAQGNYFGARHIAVNSNGDIYVKLRVHTPDGYGNLALRDVNNDGKADSVKYWGKYISVSHGTGMRIHKGYVYYSSNVIVYRPKLFLT